MALVGRFVGCWMIGSMLTSMVLWVRYRVALVVLSIAVFVSAVGMGV